MDAQVFVGSPVGGYRTALSLGVGDLLANCVRSRLAAKPGADPLPDLRTIGRAKAALSASFRQLPASDFGLRPGSQSA
jgi:hypothetical protein